MYYQDNFALNEEDEQEEMCYQEQELLLSQIENGQILTHSEEEELEEMWYEEAQQERWFEEAQQDFEQTEGEKQELVNSPDTTQILARIEEAQQEIQEMRERMHDQIEILAHHEIFLPAPAVFSDESSPSASPTESSPSASPTESSPITSPTESSPIASPTGSFPPPSYIRCPICLDILPHITSTGRSMMSTVCGHIFCSSCLRVCIRSNGRCPTCRNNLGQNDSHSIFM